MGCANEREHSSKYKAIKRIDLSDPENVRKTLLINSYSVDYDIRISGSFEETLESIISN